jgi:hypothetical protein
MSKHPFAFILVVALAFVAASQTLSADRVKLRSGQVVDGSFVSADAKVVRMLLAGSQIADFKVSDVASVEFTPRKTEPPPAAPNPARAPAPVSLPMGTMLNVRLTQAIDVDTSQAGAMFKSVLDDPVMIGGNVVVPRGAAVTLQAASVAQAGKFKGADAITLKANSIAFGGNSYEIVTTVVEQKGKGEGKKTTRKLAGGAGLGAIVGGIAGGGTGAAIGAVAGAATGAIVSASGTEHLKLPAETRLQFALSSAVSIRP